MEFAVQPEGDDKGRWVLAVDPITDRFLIADDDQSLRWVDMSRCKLVKVNNPDIPQPVVVVPQPNNIAVPNLRLANGDQRP